MSIVINYVYTSDSNLLMWIAGGGYCSKALTPDDRVLLPAQCLCSLSGRSPPFPPRGVFPCVPLLTPISPADVADVLRGLGLLLSCPLMTCSPLQIREMLSSILCPVNPAILFGTTERVSSEELETFSLPHQDGLLPPD